MIERPPQRDAGPGGAAAADVLSALLRAVRLSGSVQFCFMPTGAWQTDAAASLGDLARPLGGGGGVTPFHILVEGACWLKIEDRTVELTAGDVVVFPFGTGHQLGVGQGGRVVAPVKDLPPRPWADVPVLRYGGDEGSDHAAGGAAPVRLLCGYLDFAATGFQPLRAALPSLLHVRTQHEELSWLRATLAQIADEVDRPRAGGASVLERLTEITFVEVLRQYVAQAVSTSASGARRGCWRRWAIRRWRGAWP